MKILNLIDKKYERHYGTVAMMLIGLLCVFMTMDCFAATSNLTVISDAVDEVRAIVSGSVTKITVYAIGIIVGIFGALKQSWGTAVTGLMILGFFKLTQVIAGA